MKDFIENTLMGIEYLWGGPVKLETSEVGLPPPDEAVKPPERQQKIHWRRYVYTMEDRKLSRTLL